MEKLAQEYVRTCGDVVASMREAYPEPTEHMTPAKIRASFNSRTKDSAAFWRRVHELKAPVEKAIAMDAVGVMAQWVQIATASAADLVRVVDGGTAVELVDTDKLSPQARLLYAGAEQTKTGIKVNMRNQDAALLNIAKALGMFTEKLQVTNIDAELPPLPDDPVEAMRVYARFVKGA